MVRPTKNIRLKELSGGFQVLEKGNYVGRVSYQNLLLLAKVSRGLGTEGVMVQLLQMCESMETQGLGTEDVRKHC